MDSDVHILHYCAEGGIDDAVFSDPWSDWKVSNIG